jgi:hypothetical protein
MSGEVANTGAVVRDDDARPNYGCTSLRPARAPIIVGCLIVSSPTMLSSTRGLLSTVALHHMGRDPRAAAPLSPADTNLDAPFSLLCAASEPYELGGEIGRGGGGFLRSWLVGQKANKAGALCTNQRQIGSIVSQRGYNQRV